MNYHTQISTIVFLVLIPFFAMSQGEELKRNEIQCLEKKLYGTNDLLVNGRHYLPVHTRAEGHAYFRKNEFQEATIFIKDQAFDQVAVKYDIAQDQLIIKKQLINQNTVQLCLSRFLVDSFYFQLNPIESGLAEKGLSEADHQHFLNRRSIENLPEGPDYVMVIYSGKINFYRDFQKHFYAIYSRTTPHGRFGSEESRQYLINERGEITQISGKRDLLRYFKPHKKEIRRFMKNQSIRWNRATDQQLYSLLKFCDEIEE